MDNPQPTDSTYEAVIATYEGSSGVKLAASQWGDSSHQPVVLLHGGGQTRHAWEHTCAALARAGFFAIAVDLRGHGDSDWPADGDYTDTAIASDVAAVVSHLSTTPYFVGASLGGIVSLIYFHEWHAHEESALVLVDIAHKSEPEAAARIRRFMVANPDGFASPEEAADAIAEYLPHRKRPSSLSGLSKNLRRSVDGRYRWHWDPRFMDDPDKRAESGRRDARLTAATANLKAPLLLVRGGMGSIMSQAVVDEFMTLAPHARYVNVRDAAHMVAGDQSNAFSAIVVDFLTDARAKSEHI